VPAKNGRVPMEDFAAHIDKTGTATTCRLSPSSRTTTERIYTPTRFRRSGPSLRISTMRASTSRAVTATSGCSRTSDARRCMSRKTTSNG
jgi:hypothetical protein